MNPVHPNLIKKIVRDRWKFYMFAFILLFAFGYINTWVVATMNAKDVLGALLSQVPPFLQSTLGIDGLKNLTNLHLIMISFTHPLPLALILTFTIGLSAAGIAGEVESGTIELVMTRSITRLQFIVSHISVLLLGLTGLALSLYLGNLLGAGRFDLHFPQRIFARILASYYLLHLALGGLMMAFSAVSGEKVRVIGIGIGFVVLQFFFDFFGRSIPAIHFLAYMSVFTCHSPQHIISSGQLDTDHLVVLLAIGFAGFGFCTVYFSRRDLTR